MADTQAEGCRAPNHRDPAALLPSCRAALSLSFSARTGPYHYCLHTRRVVGSVSLFYIDSEQEALITH
ncbi:hypothetical protein J6590_048440 [Homalodisca vitripennis]|nr:hypothetical protein J6590_048440 [Homalodisca vitripennis]